MKDERRHHVRYLVPPCMVHIFTHGSTKSWDIVNISMGGLAFDYTPIPGEQVETAMLDMSCNGINSCYLSLIPCRTIYDILFLPGGNSFTGSEKRRRGIQYEKLTEEARARLTALINNMEKISNSSEFMRI